MYLELDSLINYFRPAGGTNSCPVGHRRFYNLTVRPEQQQQQVDGWSVSGGPPRRRRNIFLQRFYYFLTRNIKSSGLAGQITNVNEMQMAWSPAGGYSWTTSTCASRPARPSCTAPCPSGPASTWWATWTQVRKRLQTWHFCVSVDLLTPSVWCRHRNELRLHPRVPPPHRDVAPHQGHVARRPLQNGLRRPPHGQLSTVPPAAQPGHVPNQSVSRSAGSAAPPSCCVWYRQHWLVSCMTWLDGRWLVYICKYSGFRDFMVLKGAFFSWYHWLTSNVPSDN